MLKAVLFDMDGVIVNTEPLHRKAYFMMFSEVNISVSETLYDSFTGQSTLNICKRLVTHFNLNKPAEDLVAIKRKHFKYLFANDNDLALIDGVEDLIKTYYKNGLKLVVASSASMPNIKSIFKRFNLDQYFSGKFSGADLKLSKPHPEIFLKAAAHTGFKKSECMVIEDSTNGIKAAKSAGIYCVGFYGDPASTQDFSLADVVIKSYSEISYTKITALFK